MLKKKSTPKYESKSFMGVVYLNDQGKKDIKYLHPNYRQREMDHYRVGDKVLSKCTNMKQKRSVAQNNFMHLYFSLLAMAHGHDVTTEDVKNWAKGKHLSKGITEVFGNKTRKVRGTSDLTVGEMIEFLARVEADSKVAMPDCEPFNLGITHEEFDKLKRAEIARYLQTKPELDGI